MFQKKFVGKTKTKFSSLITFFFNRAFYEKMKKKYCRAGQATYAHCMLDTQVYKYTLRMCNSYCFSTAAMVARRPVNVTLYIHCLSCYLIMEETFVLCEVQPER